MSSQVLISKSALVHNLRAYRRAIGDTKVMSVIKSNAYGHGILEVAKAIEKETDWFGTASGMEALDLRKAGIKKPILVLSFYDPEQIADLVKKNVSLVVYDLKQARLISAAGKHLGKIANVHLKIDTGTSRLGIFQKEVAKFINEIITLKNIKIEGVFSHFAASEEDLEFTEIQNNLFNQVVEELEWRGINPVTHIACTAAGIRASKSRHSMVRLGIGLYGLWPSEKTRETANFALKPALQWVTSVIQVKTLPKGTFVGYGKSFQTTRPTQLAILPVGYFDGFDRKLSNVGEVIIAGIRCKVLGRVCMNLIMVDATSAKNVKVGDKAVLIGKMGKEEITADELAEKIGTINYEVVTRINPLIPRVVNY
ncbi:MAG TPA: alanine racemase [Methylomirabilota bacterium]|jgi:alanine racemase|nr:alanine racemase [Methylomirabilota bacterium]